MSEFILLVFIATYFVAGTIKGTLGIGFPTAAIALTANVVDARTAIVTAVIPMVLINAWQIYRSGNVKEVILVNWRLVISMMVMIAVFSVISVDVPIRWVTFILGVVTALFAFISLWRTPPRLPDRYDNRAQWATGIVSGFIGGLAGIWAPPIIAYLSSRRVSNIVFVQTSGVFLFIGSVILLISFVRSGMVHSGNALFSLSLLVPAFIGFSVGEYLRKKIANDTFQKLVLVCFFILGLNFVRRAVFV